MLFKSNILTQASGSIGGITASRNRGGMYFRARAIPTDPKTQLQLDRRANMQYASNAWNSVLDAAARAQWDTFALTATVTNALGDPIQLSGQQHYVRFATAKLLVGQPLNTDDVPTGTTIPDPAILTADDVSISGTIVTVTLGAASGTWASDPANRLLVFCSLAQDAGRRNTPRRFRYANAVAGNATPPANVTFDYAEIWDSNTAPGRLLWVKCRVLTANGLSETTLVGPATFAA